MLHVVLFYSCNIYLLEYLHVGTLDMGALNVSLHDLLEGIQVITHCLGSISQSFEFIKLLYFYQLSGRFFCNSGLGPQD